MAQLAQRFRLDLTDALAGHAKLLADLFQRSLVTVLEAESENEHFPLALREILQNVLHLLF